MVTDSYRKCILSLLNQNKTKNTESRLRGRCGIILREDINHSSKPWAIVIWPMTLADPRLSRELKWSMVGDVHWLLTSLKKRVLNLEFGTPTNNDQIMSSQSKTTNKTSIIYLKDNKGGKVTENIWKAFSTMPEMQWGCAARSSTWIRFILSSLSASALSSTATVTLRFAVMDHVTAALARQSTASWSAVYGKWRIQIL